MAIGGATILVPLHVDRLVQKDVIPVRYVFLALTYPCYPLSPSHLNIVNFIYGNQPADSPHKGPVMDGFDVFFDFSLNRLLNK